MHGRPSLSPILFFYAMIFCFAAQAAPPGDLMNLVPGDALAAINIPYAPALLKKWEASPFARFYEDPRAAGFFRPARDQLAALQRRTGVAPDRLTRFLSGQIVLAGVPSSSRSRDQLTWALLARHNGDPQILERLRRPAAPAGATLRRIPEQVAGGELIRFEILRTESAAIPNPKPRRNRKQSRPTLTAEDLGMIQGVASGEPLLKRQVSEEYEVFFGPDLIIWGGTKGHPLQKILARLAAGRDASGAYAKKADLRKIDETLGSGDVSILLSAGALAEAAVSEGGKASTLLNPAGLGLGELRAAGATINLEPGRLALRAAILAPSPRRGVSRILFLPRPPAPDMPPLLPEEATGYTGLSIPLPQLWTTLLDLARLASPAAFSLVQTQLQSFEQASGVGVQASLVDQLGGALAAFDMPGEGDRATIMVALRDGPAFRDALRALLNYSSFLGGYHLETDREGRWPVWTIAEGMAGVTGGGRPLYHLCVTDHWLLGSSRREGIDAVRKRLENPSGPSFQDQRDVQATLAKLPAERFATGAMASGGIQRLAESLLKPKLLPEGALQKTKNGSRPDLLNSSRMPERRVWSQYFGPAAISLDHQGEGIARFQGFYEYETGR